MLQHGFELRRPFRWVDLLWYGCSHMSRLRRAQHLFPIVMRLHYDKVLPDNKACGQNRVILVVFAFPRHSEELRFAISTYLTPAPSAFLT